MSRLCLAKLRAEQLRPKDNMATYGTTKVPQPVGPNRKLQGNVKIHPSFVRKHQSDKTFAHGFWVGFMTALFVVTIAVSIMSTVN